MDGVQVVQASQLGRCLVTLGKASTGTRLELSEFLEGSYEPLPSLVAAARLLFENLELPYIRRAHSAGVHAAVERVLELAHAAKRDGSRKLVLLTGVPGAGKTLVGLQVAHSAALDEGWQFGKKKRRGAPATFLSGNAANPKSAASLAVKLRREGYPIYITRDLDAAREYVRRRFAGETQRRYGLLASSRAKNLESYGIDPGFQATRRVKIARWFNDGLESPEGGCHLDTVITQFQCQGLELDLPIICWGDDFWWSDVKWRSKEGRRQRLVRDPHRLKMNAYRVLLTRGREGVIIFVPTSPAKEMDATVRALESAGALYVHTERGVVAA